MSFIEFKENIDDQIIQFISSTWQESYKSDDFIRPYWDKEIFEWRALCQKAPLFAVEYDENEICSLLCLISKEVINDGVIRKVVNVCWATSSMTRGTIKRFTNFCIAVIEQYPLPCDYILFSAQRGRTDRFWFHFSKLINFNYSECGNFSILVKQLYKKQLDTELQYQYGEDQWFDISLITSEDDTSGVLKMFQKDHGVTFHFPESFIPNELDHKNISKTFIAQYGNEVIGALTITREYYHLMNEIHCGYDIRFVDDIRLSYYDRIKFYNYIFRYCILEGADMLRMSSCVNDPFFLITTMGFIESNQRYSIASLCKEKSTPPVDFNDGVCDII